jgi:hypothetical protein
MLKLLIGMLIAGVLLQSDTLILNWSYPYNDSTYRMYSTHLADIVYISELGKDGFNDFEGSTELITLYGDADEADVHIKRLHPTCWTLTIETDYPLMDRVERDFLPCYEQRLPLIGLN